MQIFGLVLQKSLLEIYSLFLEEKNACIIILLLLLSKLKKVNLQFMQQK